MNKIALLTIHHTTNFGSALQTFALYETIKDMGFDIDLLDYRCEAIENREFLQNKKFKLRDMYRHVRYGKVFNKKKECFENFVKGYASLSDIYFKETVKDANTIYDTFITGSDIVWGLNVTGDDFSYFLDFVDDDKKKIAFASSAGLKWSQDKLPEIKRLLLRYSYIGVRETIVADWIEEITEKRPDVVVDPTMLWNREKWDKISSEPNISGNYILIYFCDSNNKIIKDAIKLGKQLNMPVYYINYGKKMRGVNSIQPLEVSEFIGLIKNASYVFSASFHGLLFSLYFHKEVFYYNRANFSRMESLAKWLNIEDHNGMKIDEFVEVTHIDYQKVDKKIEDKRKQSLDLLYNNLKEE